MANIRENGVHKDDKQWSMAFRDFALDLMKLTFAVNSSAGNDDNSQEDKWMELYRRFFASISSNYFLPFL